MVQATLPTTQQLDEFRDGLEEGWLTKVTNKKKAENLLCPKWQLTNVETGKKHLRL